MKESERYKKAQVAVINSEFLCIEDKLEVLRELMDAEKLALYNEERER